MTIAWGTSLSKTHLDASTDDPSQARAELEAVIDRINTKLAGVTLIQSTDLSNNGSSGTVAETTGGGFPNVNADVTATDEELNKLDGLTATTAELNNADADTSGGGFLIGPTTSSDPALAFDTWRTPNANRTTTVVVTITVIGTGGSLARVFIDVDESGGTAGDYSFKIEVWPASGDDDLLTGTISFPAIAGASYRIRNVADPGGSNAIIEHREFTW